VRRPAARLALLLVLPIVAGCAAWQHPGPRETQYTNPVIRADFPDPGLLRGPDGAFYAYATHTSIAGRWMNVQVARSPDLVTWKLLGDALP